MWTSTSPVPPILNRLLTFKRLNPFTMSTPIPDAIKDIVEKFPASYLIISLSEQAGKSADHNPAMNVHVPFKGAEIYLLHKSFIDSGGAPGESYKSLFEKTASHLANKNQKGFSTESLQKCSDKVDYESKENVKRFLQKMIRNIDSY
jgi:hypothetical protein